VKKRMTSPGTPSKSQEQTTKAEEESLSTEELEERLATTPEGLTAEEAASRLEKYGYNEIPEKTVSPFLKFLTYFWGPILPDPLAFPIPLSTSSS
jgi:H+-transporting ATPase